MKVRFVTLGKHRFIYAFSWHAALSLCDLLGRIELFGEENIPHEPCLIVGNHVSFLDPPALAFYHDTPLCVIARDTLMQKGLWKRYFTALDAIPVKRGESGNLAAFKAVFARLKEGKSIIIFPEGTRSPDGALQGGKAGAGLIALKANVPIVPIRTFGFEDVLPRSNKIGSGSRITMVAGKPIYPKDIDPGKAHPERAQYAVDKMMEALASIKNPRTFEV